MRKHKQKITDPAIIRKILKNAVICRIAMLDGDQPYLLPFNYGYTNNHIYIHSASTGKKIKLLQKNSRVCFEIEDRVEIVKADKACDWATRYRSLVGYGTVEIITDPEQKRKGLDIIMSQHGRAHNNIYNNQTIDRMVILKLRIDSITGKQSAN